MASELEPELSVTESAESGTSDPTATKASDNAATSVDDDAPMAHAEGDEETMKLKAVRQLEFYFSDANLPYDRFMWTLYTANDDHWIKLATVASFKRMRPFSEPPRSPEWVAAALRDKSEQLEVDESGENVRRKTEVKEPVDALDRSVYAKGFGTTDDPKLQSKLEVFFEKYGLVNAVRMRRGASNEFKGSVFAEFADVESVKCFLEADPKPAWDGEDLLIMTKEAYCEMKIQEKGLKGKAAEIRKRMLSTPQRKGFNAFHEMAKQAKGKDGAKSKEAPEVYLEFMGKRVRVHEEDGEGRIDEAEWEVVPRASMRFDGCDGACNYKEVKEPLAERFAKLPYIKYEKESDWGVLGFDKSLSEEEELYVREHVKQINGKDVTWRVLEDEEERKFQLERVNFAAARVFTGATRGQKGTGRGGRGGGRGRGGRGGGRGGGGRDRGEKRENGQHKATEDKQAEKRKRSVEPDGGPEMGVRGAGIPSIVSRSSSKKAKLDEAGAES